MPNELTPTQPTAAPAVQHASIQVQGFGNNIEMSDIRFPRIELVQAMSSVAQDGTHTAGSLINSLTKQKLEAPVEIIPVFVTKSAIRWKPRSEGGGIIYKTSNLKDPAIQADIAWNGDQKPLATVYINIVCKVKGENMPLVASFCNTSQKTGFNLISMMAMSGSAWNYRYILSSVVKEKTGLGRYFIFEARMGTPTTAEEKAAALELYRQVSVIQNIDTDYEGDTTVATETQTDGVAIQGQPEEF